MLKTKDIQPYLREFNSLFSPLGRHFDASRLFDDFLTIIICCLARQTQEDWYLETVKKYKREHLKQFAKVLGTLFLIYDKHTFQGDWVDPLGDYYEALAGNYKKQGFGQFFTPKSLCDIMATITIKEHDYGGKVNDCAVGSGRTLLAANKICKGKNYIAQDIDHICVKMCAINMAFHGLKGKVLHMDSLMMNKPHHVYTINSDWHKTKTPFILKN